MSGFFTHFDYCFQCYEDQLQEAKKFEDLMNERLRTMCKEKEKAKRLLSERELDIVKLECRLVDSTNECRFFLIICGPILLMKVDVA